MLGKTSAFLSRRLAKMSRAVLRHKKFNHHSKTPQRKYARSSGGQIVCMMVAPKRAEKSQTPESSERGFIDTTAEYNGTHVPPGCNSWRDAC